MYTLRIEERGERRVSSMVPRTTTAAAGASSSTPSPTAAAAEAAAAAGAPATNNANDDPAASLYDEVFRAPVPDGGAVEFSAGNPRVEHINGLVHLYRRTAAPGDDGSAAADADAATATTTTSRTVCCLAIPSDMAVASFCSFIGAYLEHAKELRVLRREGLGNGNGGGNGGGNSAKSSPSAGGVCMVLIEFSEQAQADDFFADYNGRPFSALEPEILCRLVYVREVEVIEAGRRGQQQKEEEGGKKKKGAGGGGGDAKDNASSVRPPASFLPAPPGHTELPSCPVCLERLDEHVTGV
jgi:BRCA1-associated protein